ncbi:MAG: multidrug efflux RND transporter permease subunit [Phycisphaerales bacterium]
MIDFFIRRPIFATVIALLMVIAGGLAMAVLPVAQFPQIAPPTVMVMANYPGASAETTSNVVTRLLEKQINGVPGMIYMSSNSVNGGQSTITVTFDVGYDLSIGTVDVQNYAQTAIPQLPSEVQLQGISVRKQSTDFVQVVALESPRGTYDADFLSNYADINIVQTLQRIPGVGSVQNFGLRQYSMRIWLDTQKLAALRITPQEVAAAISEQNKQAVGGQSGAAPYAGNPAFTMQVNTLGRLEQVEQFEKIVVRRDASALVYLKDVARVELGAATYSTNGRQDGKGAALLGVFQLPGSNAFNVAEGVRQAMTSLSKDFPGDIEYRINFDTTEFVKASIEEVVGTFWEAAVLVLLIIFIFLQSFRTTLIPMLAIPVSIIGTFAVMLALGFSINTLTLLGLVLAIGLVVDDAIVVIENVERKFEEGETDPYKAASKAMKEVAGPIIATTLSLVAVFVPASLMPGITGQLYNQFAMTIAISVVLSGINSLTLSPALSALFLRPRHIATKGPFGLFNRAFTRTELAYESTVGWLVRRWYVAMAAFAVAIAATLFLVLRTPTAFIPDEDNGYFFVAYQLPAGSTLDRTDRVAKEARAIIAAQPEVQTVIEINGLNFIANATQTNAGVLIPVLKPWSERKKPENSTTALVARLNGLLYPIADCNIFAFNPPSIPGLGTVGGFQMQVNDRSGVGIDALYGAAMAVIKETQAHPDKFGGVTTFFQRDVPQLWLEIDRVKMQSLGVGVADAFAVLQLNFGSAFINQFNRFNQVYQVYVQADATSRMNPEDLEKLYATSREGGMVPFSAFATVRTTTGPDNVTHYNVTDSIALNGTTMPGVSSGEAVALMDEICARVLPKGITRDWTGIVYQELKAANAAPIVFTLAIVAVFLFLAAQYESWTLPVLVVICVPFAALGAVLGLRAAGLPLDVYAQIGLVMLIGLSAKNAILIVEFAKQATEHGKTPLQAAMDAARLRLRPILMTSLSFILGVIPLVLATGAGANARRSIGITVLVGLAVATVLTLIIVPVFYALLTTVRDRFWGSDDGDEDEEGAPAGTPAPVPAAPVGAIASAGDSGTPA